MSQPAGLERYRWYEIYSQSTGVEIRAAIKTNEEHGQVTERCGRIQAVLGRTGRKEILTYGEEELDHEDN